MEFFFVNSTDIEISRHLELPVSATFKNYMFKQSNLKGSMSKKLVRYFKVFKAENGS
jgi:hypothetical protein